MSEERKRGIYGERLPTLSVAEEERFLRVLWNGNLLSASEARKEVPACYTPTIEVIGTPGAGKTSAIIAASEYLKARGVPHRVIKEREIPWDKYEFGSFDWDLYQLQMTLDVVRTLAEQYFNDKKEGLTLVDRGIYNSFSFMDADVATHGRSSLAIANHVRERNEISKRFIESKFGTFTDALVCFTANPQVAIERSSGTGRVRTPEYLSALNDAVEGLAGEVCRIKSVIGTDFAMVFSKIDANQSKEVCQDLFMKTIGSICSIYTA
ncbi:MAG: hypothetical protein AAB875_07470 [Patescibacteria group bacterium]